MSPSRCKFSDDEQNVVLTESGATGFFCSFTHALAADPGYDLTDEVVLTTAGPAEPIAMITQLHEAASIGQPCRPTRDNSYQTFDKYWMRNQPSGRSSRPAGARTRRQLNGRARRCRLDHHQRRRHAAAADRRGCTFGHPSRGQPDRFGCLEPTVVDPTVLIQPADDVELVPGTTAFMFEAERLRAIRGIELAPLPPVRAN